MLSIFSCACWPSGCILWRNVYLHLLPTFLLGCLFVFWYWAVWVIKQSPLLSPFWNVPPFSSANQWTNPFSKCLFVMLCARRDHRCGSSWDCLSPQGTHSLMGQLSSNRQTWFEVGVKEDFPRNTQAWIFYRILFSYPQLLSIVF